MSRQTKGQLGQMTKKQLVNQLCAYITQCTEQQRVIEELKAENDKMVGDMATLILEHGEQIAALNEKHTNERGNDAIAALGRVNEQKDLVAHQNRTINRMEGERNGYEAAVRDIIRTAIQEYDHL